MPRHQTFNRDIRVTRKAEGGGFEHVPIACLVTVTVDFERLASPLGQKAFKNKSKLAKYLQGAVLVQAKAI